MKPICILYILLACIIFTSCKKEKNSSPGTGTPAGTFPEWVTYNNANSQVGDDQINALAIDKNDVKWIGTANGLVRLSGNSWQAFNTGNSSLPSSHITAVAVEDNGAVWVGTARGLARYNGNSWSVYTTANSVLTSNVISRITHDAKHQTTWVATEDGLVKIDAASHWEHFEIFNVILSMATDQNGALWLGLFNDFAFRGSIRKFENNQWTVYQLHDMGYPSALPYGLAVDQQNRPVVVLAGTVVKSVLRLNGTGWEEVPRPEKATGLKTVLLDGDKIWVGGKTLSVFGDKGSPVISLPGTDSPILCMAQDSKGRKWLGTLWAGLTVYSPATR